MFVAIWANEDDCCLYCTSNFEELFIEIEQKLNAYLLQNILWYALRNILILSIQLYLLISQITIDVTTILY